MLDADDSNTHIKKHMVLWKEGRCSNDCHAQNSRKEAEKDIFPPNSRLRKENRERMVILIVIFGNLRGGFCMVAFH